MSDTTGKVAATADAVFAAFRSIADHFPAADLLETGEVEAAFSFHLENGRRFYGRVLITEVPSEISDEVLRGCVDETTDGHVLISRHMEVFR